jgi:hypothetical protein
MIAIATPAPTMEGTPGPRPAGIPFDLGSRCGGLNPLARQLAGRPSSSLRLLCRLPLSTAGVEWSPINPAGPAAAPAVQVRSYPGRYTSYTFVRTPIRTRAYVLHLSRAAVSPVPAARRSLVSTVYQSLAALLLYVRKVLTA